MGTRCVYHHSFFDSAWRVPTGKVTVAWRRVTKPLRGLNRRIESPSNYSYFAAASIRPLKLAAVTSHPNSSGLEPRTL